MELSLAGHDKIRQATGVLRALRIGEKVDGVEIDEVRSELGRLYPEYKELVVSLRFYIFFYSMLSVQYLHSPR